MDRPIVYAGSLPKDIDFLNDAQSTMVALGWLTQAVMGVPATIAGLSCVPGGGMFVTVSPGVLFQQAALESSNYGALPADGTLIVKSGILKDAVTIGPFVAPATPGQSVVALIQGSYGEADINPLVLPYANVTNPAIPFNGPNNSGLANNTTRAQQINLSVIYGAPAATGSQVPPAGTVAAIATVTLTYGQTAIVSGDIAVAPGAPYVTPLPQVAAGRLLNVQTFAASGTYYKTPGTNRSVVEMVGGGGGSGSTSTTTSGQLSVTGGASGGSYAKIGVTVTNVASVAVTVGMAGAGGTSSGVNGGNGGSTSFGGYCTCPGGVGGLGGIAQTTTGLWCGPGAPSPSGASFAGSLAYVSVAGWPGNYGVAFPGGAIAGVGGSSPLGAGGGDGGASAATGYGGGGGGVGQAGASSWQYGANGSQGYVVVWEYS